MTQTQRTGRSRESSQRASHSSLFFTGFFALVFHPLRDQVWIHWVIPFCTYWESVCTATGTPFGLGLAGKTEKRFADGNELHAVVRRLRFETRLFLLPAGGTHDVCPAAGPRVAHAPSIGPDLDLLAHPSSTMRGNASRTTVPPDSPLPISMPPSFLSTMIRAKYRPSPR